MNIISFSLWGSDPKYTVGAIKNAELAKHFYEDWQCFFYVGSDVPHETVDHLEKFENVTVIKVDETNDWSGMLWRFFAIDVEDAEHVIFRDTDSRLSTREKMAVDEWMSSPEDYFIHGMRDHPEHTEKIMGGMWGVKVIPFLEQVKKRIAYRGQTVKSFKEVIDYWTESKSDVNHYGVDQEFLHLFYDNFKTNLLCHDSYPNWNGHSRRNPVGDYGVIEFNTGFPVRHNTKHDFVGQVYDANNVPVDSYANRLNQVYSIIYNKELN